MFDFFLGFLAHALKSSLGVVGTRLLLQEETFLSFFTTFVNLGEYVTFGELTRALHLASNSSVMTLVLSLTRDKVKNLVDLLCLVYYPIRFDFMLV